MQLRRFDRSTVTAEVQGLPRSRSRPIKWILWWTTKKGKCILCKALRRQSKIMNLVILFVIIELLVRHFKISETLYQLIIVLLILHRWNIKFMISKRKIWIRWNLMLWLCLRVHRLVSFENLLEATLSLCTGEINIIITTITLIYHYHWCNHHWNIYSLDGEWYGRSSSVSLSSFAFGRSTHRRTLKAESSLGGSTELAREASPQTASIMITGLTATSTLPITTTRYGRVHL